MVDFVEDIVETDVKPEDIAHIIETDLDKEKKTRNSPSKKIQTIEERLDIHEQEMKGLRDYIRRLEDFFIYKLKGTVLPEPPVSLLEDKKRHYKDEPEPEEREITTSAGPAIEPPVEKKKRKLRRDQAVAIPAPETGKKKRGRPKGSKNKK